MRESRHVPRRALICSPLLPEYDREGGSKRLYTFVEFLIDGGWAVTYAARQAGGGERYIHLLQQRGVETYTSLDGALEQAIETRQFDLAILAFWYVAEQCLPAIRRLSPCTRILVDSIDLHFLRNARRASLGSGPGLPPITLDANFASEAIRELNAYAAADGVLAVSDKEAALIDDLAGGPNLASIVPLEEDLQASQIPFLDRRGIVFVGNFRHPPNLEAAEYLLREILPRLDPRLLAEHPVYVVGNALDHKLKLLHSLSPDVHMVGWVPSVLPYLERARIAVVPLLHGAGTKQKVVQALMVGTPTVASSIGVEGLGIRSGEHALVADDADGFAMHVAHLIRDEDLWRRLAVAGRAHVSAQHGREAVRERFDRAISVLLARVPKKLRLSDVVASDARRSDDDNYRQLVQRVRAVVRAELPRGARVAVVSKGDEELLKLDNCFGWHYPRGDDGGYAGHYPADSAAAIAHLESLHVAGAQFLVFPRTAFWWLDYYSQFREHLERHCQLVVSQSDTCLIFKLDSVAGEHVRLAASTG
jgi:glycosyltransferase involved in cell wall biosynthesis